MQATTMSSPQTPPRHGIFSSYSNKASFQPQMSSPLASSPASSPNASPVREAQARRRGQYKGVGVSFSSTNTSRARRLHDRPSTVPHVAAETPTPSTEEAPRKVFLRERFRARCLERAQRDRENKIRRKRGISVSSSDGFDEMMDDDEDEEDEEAVMNDEFFARIMASIDRSRLHSYRVSYAWEVGSSFDPDMEDPEEWENELKDPQCNEDIPAEFDEEELAAYADEYDLHFSDIPPEELFSLSDLEEDEAADVRPTTTENKESRKYPDEDVDMDL